ncbi:hypothetical protein MKX01_008548 [Papaver californicum]|nr:hypothetical protein MKX01_008548 [Papaver californicum]
METSKEEEALLFLLKKLQELEAKHASLQQEFSNLTLHQHEVSSRPRLEISCEDRKKGMDLLRHSSSHFSDKRYLNLLQSTGQAIHIFDFTGLISYWNTAAEKLYGYSASEVLGQNGLDLVVDGDVDVGIDIMQKIAAGEKWTGIFPVKNKQGKRFEVLATNTPLFLQLPSVSFSEADSSFSQPTSGPPSKPDHDSQQPQQVGSFTLRLDVPNLPTVYFMKLSTLQEIFFRDYGGEGKIGIHKIVTSRGESWISKKQISRPWKGSEHDGLVGRNTHDIFGWMTNKQDDNPCQPKSSDSYERHISSYLEVTDLEIKPLVCGPLLRLPVKDRFLHYDILWEELTICEQIGRGTTEFEYCYLFSSVHPEPCIVGSGVVRMFSTFLQDVALKVFSKFEYSDDLLHSFRQEGLRHLNVLLIMGAVTLPEHLCIVTEFLPRGNLFQLLRRSTYKLDWRRRVLMALDTVGDFGLSRLKHATFLTRKTGKGTAQWMAPEVMRNDPSDEKSDVYGFGVILWEIATGKIPWNTLNSMQVTGAVGFMGQRIQIPKDTDPQWASLIESCWHSEPKCRPSFQELLEKLKDLQKRYSSQPCGACLDLGGSSISTSAV